MVAHRSAHLPVVAADVGQRLSPAIVQPAFGGQQVLVGLDGDYLAEKEIVAAQRQAVNDPAFQGDGALGALSLIPPAAMNAAYVTGQAVTPYLLSRVSELTHGASLKANLSLLKNNARVAAQVARYLNPTRRQVRA